jgi:hypothetical protein
VKPILPAAFTLCWRADMAKSVKRAQGIKIVFLQTQEHIPVNETFSPPDFSR